MTLYDTENNICNQDYVELRISTTRNVVVVYYKTFDIQLILFKVHIDFLLIYIYQWTFECYLVNQVLGAIIAIIYYEPKRSRAEMAMGRNNPEPVRRGPKQTWFVQPQTASSLIFRIYAPIICIPPPPPDTHLRGWVGIMTVPFRA